MKNRHLADRTLIISGIVFVIVTATQIFIGKNNFLYFLEIVSAAALVGGIADWYGVVSIYGRPLGISYKTELILSQRKQLTNGIRNFVCNSVFNEDNLNQMLNNLHMIDRLVSLLKNKKGDSAPLDWFVNFLSSILWNAFDSLESSKVGNVAARLFERIVDSESPSAEIAKMLKNGLSEDRLTRIINTISPQLRALVNNPGLEQVLFDMSQRAIDNYRDSEWYRKIFPAGISDTLYNSAKDAVKEYLDGFVNDPNHPGKKKLINKILKIISKFEENKELQDKIDQKICDLVVNKTVTDIVSNEINRLKISCNEETIDGWISKATYYLVDKFESNPKMKLKVEKHLIHFITSVALRNKSIIGDFLEFNLNSLTEQELVDFIKKNTEGDLQVIRINGMVVGVLISVVIFSLKYVIGIF